MATDLNLVGPQLNTTRGQQFIPELWLQEIQMFRQAALLDKSILKTWTSAVKKGDTYHVPRISELAIEDKASDTAVSIQANNDTDFVITVDTDRVTGVGVDILLDVQSQYPLRAPYVKAMGYALAKDYTGSILGLRAAVNNTAAFNVFCSSNGAISGNGTALNYASLLAARNILLSNDVADGDDLENNLALIVSPTQETALLGISEFKSADFMDKKFLVSGQIGMILGMKVIRTSLIGNNSLTGWRNGASNPLEPTPGVTGSRYVPRQDAFTSLPLTFTGNSRPVQTAIVCHSEWAAGVVSKEVAVTESFENREQVNLWIGRQAYGTRLYRPGHAVNIHTSNDVV